jgi:hypothetical protein
LEKFSTRGHSRLHCWALSFSFHFNRRITLIEVDECSLNDSHESMSATIVFEMKFLPRTQTFDVTDDEHFLMSITPEHAHPFQRHLELARRVKAARSNPLTSAREN